MSRYVRNPTRKFTFDGDDVTVVLKPLSQIELASLGSAESRVDEVTVMGKIVEKNVVSIAGILDNEGKEVDVATVAHEAYFVQLAAEIFKALVEVSQPANP